MFDVDIAKLPPDVRCYVDLYLPPLCSRYADLALSPDKWFVQLLAKKDNTRPHAKIHGDDLVPCDELTRIIDNNYKEMDNETKAFIDDVAKRLDTCYGLWKTNDTRKEEVEKSNNPQPQANGESKTSKKDVGGNIKGNKKTTSRSSYNMAPFVVDTDNDSRSSPVSADNSATRIEMTANTQSKGSPAMEFCAIEDGCYYSEFFESGGVDKSNNDMSNTSTTFCSWYSTKTETHPLLTSSLTGGVCACVGDVIAQFIENSMNLRQDSTYGLHYRRTIAVFTAGLCYGPLLQTLFVTLDHILPIHCIDKDNCLIDNAFTDSEEEDDIDISAKSREIVDDMLVEAPVSNYCYSTMFHSFSLVSTKVYVNAFIHVAIDQGIMAFPFVALMMFVTGIVEGHWNKLGQEFSEDYIDNIYALWLAAIFGIGPLQIIAFRYLDLKWRALAANLLDVLEVMVMSYLTHRNREAPQYDSNDDDSWIYETHDYGSGSADE